MTKRKTSIFRGTRCRICTGCGRCAKGNTPTVVSAFCAPAPSKGDAPGCVPGTEGSPVPLLYLVCADIGTTTIAMQLRRVADGAVEQTFTCVNPQRVYGADVLSRIQAAEDPVKKAMMKHMVREALAEGVNVFRQRLSCFGSDQKPKIERLAIAGNTTMLHLFMGYDTSGLGVAPFAPHSLSEVRTVFLGIDTVLLPGISAFVGADITADIVALSMQRRPEVTLLLDLGTNGEMVLGNRERLIATATAAGPAFEGGTDSFGADLMAVCAGLREEGLLDETGLLKEPYFSEGIEAGGAHITRENIRALQLAKAAVAAGIRIMCRKYGLRDADRIDRIFLAGGMGYYLDPQAAAEIGLIPKEWAKKTCAVGNAVLEGAFLYGREQGAEKPAEDGTDSVVLPAVECFNLAVEPDFEREYIASMSLEQSTF